jgi:hypothetical protein
MDNLLKGEKIPETVEELVQKKDYKTLEQAVESSIHSVIQ